jgi:hypothetical protein
VVAALSWKGRGRATRMKEGEDEMKKGGGDILMNLNFPWSQGNRCQYPIA